MKKLGIPWDYTKHSPLEPGVLYHWANAAVWERAERIELVEAERMHGLGYLFVLFEYRRIRPGYGSEYEHIFWYRPLDESKWKEEAQTILDLMQAGGVEVADDVELKL
jgi:hypothetical protein